MFNEYTVKDEYDPMKPNDYTIQLARREVQRRVAKEEERRKEVEARRRSVVFIEVPFKHVYATAFVPQKRIH